MFAILGMKNTKKYHDCKEVNSRCTEPCHSRTWSAVFTNLDTQQFTARSNLNLGLPGLEKQY